MADDVPALGSRGGSSSPFGKLVDFNIKLSEATKDGVSLLAAAQGMTPSEYARQFFDEHVHGRLPMLRAALRRTGPLSSTGMPHESEGS